MKTVSNLIIRALFSCYQLVVSPALHALAGPGAGCRFEKTCSQFALESLLEFGVIRGGWRAVRRMMTCNPWANPGRSN